jgi:hypothetical protein
MTAGVPGLGLGGLFALFAALCLPMLASGSRRGSGRLVGMALIIVVAALVAWQSVNWLYSVVSGQPVEAAWHSLSSGPAALTQPVVGQPFTMPVLVISLALMITLLLGGELLYRVLGVRPTPLPPPIPAPALANATVSVEAARVE